MARTRMKSKAPAQKVVAGSLGAALATLVVFALNLTVFKEDKLDAEVSGAITTVITFLFGYFVPPSERDQIDVEADANAVRTQ